MLKFIPPLKTCIILWVVCTVVSWLLIPAVSRIVFVLLLALTAVGVVLRKKNGSDAENTAKELDEIEKQIEAITDADPQIRALREEIRELEEIVDALSAEKTQVLFQSKLGKNNAVIFASVSTSSPRLKIDGAEMGIVGKPCRIVPLTPGIHSISFVVEKRDSEWTTHDQQFSINENNLFFVFDATWHAYDGTSRPSFKLEKYTEMGAFLRESKITEEAFTEFVVKL